MNSGSMVLRGHKSSPSSSGFWQMCLYLFKHASVLLRMGLRYLRQMCPSIFLVGYIFLSPRRREEIPETAFLSRCRTRSMTFQGHWGEPWKCKDLHERALKNLTNTSQCHEERMKNDGERQKATTIFLAQ